MRVSVVTPSFNQGRFIGQCLASVSAQTGIEQIEHIVLDNCSVDLTNAILQQRAIDCGVVKLLSVIEPDRGQTHAINKGFALATGDVLCWLNTDERYKSGALSRVADYFRCHPEVDVVFGDVEFVDADQEPLRVKRECGFSPSMLLYYGCFIPSCATFVRAEAARRAGQLDESLRVVMDFDWYLRLHRSGASFAHIPEVLASFTWHDSNISSTFVERRLAERRIVQDRYSGLRGPRWIKTILYYVMKRMWMAFRLIKRMRALVPRGPL